MNPILCLLRNNLDLTRKAVKTFRAQDVGEVQILLIDNASTDGTGAWASTQRDIGYIYHAFPQSVAASWNLGLNYFFITKRADYVLVVNNDVELRPDTYRWLLADGGEFVTAVGSRDPNCILQSVLVDITGPRQPGSIGTAISDSFYPNPNPAHNRPHPDFSCFLMRRSLYEKVGPFDENFKIAYAEDADYHVRMYRAGYHAHCIDLPYLHHGARTIKNADPAEIRRIQLQAERNRAYFKEKYGFAVASKEYYDSFNSSPPPSE